MMGIGEGRRATGKGESTRRDLWAFLIPCRVVTCGGEACFALARTANGINTIRKLEDLS